LTGNIDIGENTENALAAKAVTQVASGTRMTVTIHQVNADGAGPYACDLVEAGNNGIITQNLTVENNVPGVNGFSQAKAQDFNVTVVMPTNFTCTGCQYLPIFLSFGFISYARTHIFLTIIRHMG
jgi:hypothetical protein